MCENGCRHRQQTGGVANIELVALCRGLRFQLRDAGGQLVRSLSRCRGDGRCPAGRESLSGGHRWRVQTVYNQIKALLGWPGGGGAGDDAAASKARAKGSAGKFAWLDSSSCRTRSARSWGAAGRFAVHHLHGLMSTSKSSPNWADQAEPLSPTWQFVNLCWQSVFVFCR